MHTPAFKAGMVRFLAEGARDYYRSGIPAVPGAFRALTSTMPQANNPMAGFVQGGCTVDPRYQHGWAQANHDEVLCERRCETLLADFREGYSDWRRAQCEARCYWNQATDRRALEHGRASHSSVVEGAPSKIRSS
jgi:hypothetical protein